MIKITKDKENLDKNLEKIDAVVERIEKRAVLCLRDLDLSFELFWGLPDAELEEVLNHYGEEQLGAIFAAHARNGQALVDLLADRGVGYKFKSEIPRTWTVEDGVITLDPLPEPEEEE